MSIVERKPQLKLASNDAFHEEANKIYEDVEDKYKDLFNDIPCNENGNPYLNINGFYQQMEIRVGTPLRKKYVNPMAALREQTNQVWPNPDPNRKYEIIGVFTGTHWPLGLGFRRLGEFLVFLGNNEIGYGRWESLTISLPDIELPYDGPSLPILPLDAFANLQHLTWKGHRKQLLVSWLPLVPSLLRTLITLEIQCDIALQDCCYLLYHGRNLKKVTLKIIQRDLAHDQVLDFMTPPESRSQQLATTPASSGDSGRSTPSAERPSGSPPALPAEDSTDTPPAISANTADSLTLPTSSANTPALLATTPNTNLSILPVSTANASVLAGNSNANIGAPIPVTTQYTEQFFESFRQWARAEATEWQYAPVFLLPEDIQISDYVVGPESPSYAIPSSVDVLTLPATTQSTTDVPTLSFESSQISDYILGLENPSDAASSTDAPTLSAATQSTANVSTSSFESSQTSDYILEPESPSYATSNADVPTLLATPHSTADVSTLSFESSQLLEVAERRCLVQLDADEPEQNLIIVSIDQQKTFEFIEECYQDCKQRFDNLDVSRLEVKATINPGSDWSLSTLGSLG
ncbi:hypothetical protein E4T56_gene7349 [Termitomyces sp. T112]|nr:hypothetical protein E4T56_gene7349 [Termitomyces sp. T112]